MLLRPVAVCIIQLLSLTSAFRSTPVALRHSIARDVAKPALPDRPTTSLEIFIARASLDALPGHGSSPYIVPRSQKKPREIPVVAFSAMPAICPLPLIARPSLRVNPGGMPRTWRTPLRSRNAWPSFTPVTSPTSLMPYAMLIAPPLPVVSPILSSLPSWNRNAGIGVPNPTSLAHPTAIPALLTAQELLSPYRRLKEPERYHAPSDCMVPACQTKPMYLNSGIALAAQQLIPR